MTEPTNNTPATPASAGLTENLRNQVQENVNQKAQARANIMAQTTDFVIGVPTELKKPVTYAMTADGVVYIRHAQMADFVLKPTVIPGLEHLDFGMHLRIPKVPFELVCQCLAFFQAVHQRDATEASALIYFDPDTQQHFIYVPEQRNSAGLSEFHMDPEVQKLRDTKVAVMELHSHGGGGPFWSATDNANENMAQCYMVFGTVNAVPTYKIRYCCAGVQQDICIWDLVEKPKFQMKVGKLSYPLPVPDVIDKFPAVEFPADWMDRTKKSYTVGAYNNSPTSGTILTGSQSWQNRESTQGRVPLDNGVVIYTGKPGAEGAASPNAQTASLKNGKEWYIHPKAGDSTATGATAESDEKKICSDAAHVVLLYPSGKLEALDGTPISVASIEGHPLSTKSIINRVVDEFLPEEVAALTLELIAAGHLMPILQVIESLFPSKEKTEAGPTPKATCQNEFCGDYEVCQGCEEDNCCECESPTTCKLRLSY